RSAWTEKNQKIQKNSNQQFEMAKGNDRINRNTDKRTKLLLTLSCMQYSKVTSWNPTVRLYHTSSPCNTQPKRLERKEIDNLCSMPTAIPKTRPAYSNRLSPGAHLTKLAAVRTVSCASAPPVLSSTG